MGARAAQAHPAGGKSNRRATGEVGARTLPTMTESWSEKYRIAAKNWVELDAAANLLEETKSANLSQMMLSNNADSVSKAEMLAKASPRWTEYVSGMVEARRKANKAKVELEWIRMKFSEQQSSEATARAERRL
jgi:hypothetical protein